MPDLNDDQWQAIDPEILAQRMISAIKQYRAATGAELKDAKNAQDQFEAASLVDSNNVEARLGLAEAQIQQSDFAGAVPDLEALTKSDPSNGAALRLLARAYRGLGREPDAQKADAKAAATDKKN